MEKNQIFITCGTEYKEMTKRILEESGLAEQIGNKAFPYRNQAQYGFPFSSV